MTTGAGTGGPDEPSADVGSGGSGGGGDAEAGAPSAAAPAPTVERPARRMLEALVCPLTGAALRYDAEAGELISRAAGLAYPIRSGIPIMLVDSARKITD